METRKIEKTNRTTGLVASVALAIALTVAVTFAWGFGNVERADASGSGPPATVDLNGDGQVALGDLMIVVQCLGKTTSDPGCELSDTNGDGGIGLSDLMLVVKFYGQKV